MRKTWILLLALFLCAIARAQTTQNPLAVNLTAQSTDCSVANSCAWQLLNFSAGTSVVTLAGTFSGTFIVEQTNNGTTWTSAGTVTSAGTTSYSSNGFTAIRVRCSAFTSGTAAVTVSTGTGGSSTGAGGGISLVTSLPATCTPGVTANVQLSAASSGYIAGTEFYCYATNTWKASGNVVNTTGAFSSSASSEYLQSVIGAANCNLFLNGTNKVTDAISGCIITPASGVTNGFSDAIAGYAQINDPNQGGQFGKAEVVGVYGNCQAAANNTVCIGVAPQASSTAGLTGERIEGQEVGMIPGSTTTTGYGFLLGFLGTNVQPASGTDNLPGVVIQTPSGSGTFTTGFECQTGATASQVCLKLFPTATGSGINSQAISLAGTNASAVAVSAGIQLYYDNALLLGSPHITISNTAGEESFGSLFTSTVALPLGSLVKIDSANSDAFVLCATTDTICQGFSQGTSTAGGSCVVSSTLCPIATVPGSKVKGILGTGTCSIGNYVIADTTTGGRVKCVTAQPPYWVGTALSAQASVGSIFDILTAFQFASTGTATNCGVSSASPAACGSAPAGSVAVPTAATTYTVNTTAVTANSQIFIQQDTSATLGTRLGVTCNTTVSTALPLLTAKVAGTSFTFSLTAPAVNPACFSYLVVN